MNKKTPYRILISRTDAIGDVVLTFPSAGLLKKQFPECRIIFFGRTYTQPVIAACEHVDEFINYDDFTNMKESERTLFLKQANADAIIHVFPRHDIAAASKAAGIDLRIGTTNRLYHWWTCNRMIASGRKNSDLHEAQLNAKLLKPFGIPQPIRLSDLKKNFGLKKIKLLPEEFKRNLSTDKFNLILHPKSNISAREWSLERYLQLILILSPEKFNIIITGSDKEKTALQDWLPTLPPHVHNLTGKLTLDELIAFIAHSDGLVAASTGPLHLAGALGKHTFGIYPPIRPMHPGRWAPLGDHAGFAVIDKSCSECRNDAMRCHCMNEITALQVADRILNWRKI